MKKSFQKLVRGNGKLNPAKLVNSKLLFADHREDFVITAQEEKEGGYFGRAMMKLNSHSKNA